MSREHLHLNPDATAPETLPNTPPGDAIALRARRPDNGHEFVLAGRVAAAECLRHEAAAETVVTLDANVWWSLSDGRVIDRSGTDWFRDPPPVQPYLGDEPQEPPPPAIVVREDATVGVALPSPVLRGSGRVVHYDTRPDASLVEMVTGPIVDPAVVLPNDTVPPEEAP